MEYVNPHFRAKGSIVIFEEPGQVDSEDKEINEGFGWRRYYDGIAFRDLFANEDCLVLKPVTFLFGDNMILLRWLKDNMMKGKFHCGIVDPPYGISVGSMNLGDTKDSKPRNFKMGDWDNEIPTLEYWYLLRYACRNLVVWGGNYFTKELPFAGRSFDVWDKLNENMSFAWGELALTDFDMLPSRIQAARTKKSDYHDGDKRHPTQKPVYVYDFQHLKYELKGKKVLDTHGGSFSHAIAAAKTGVELTIIDSERSYFDSGVKAYKETTSGKSERLF